MPVVACSSRDPARVVRKLCPVGCIGCGACVAACPNGSAMLFVAAKVSQMASLPQGQVEAKERVRNMLAEMESSQTNGELPLVKWEFSALH